MGTLTAGQPRLAEYCDHKLPTSCRLTSIPNCCACADERAHAASYSTYIDGVGFVQRGNRWQRYCWFCKEFWENRVQVSGLRTGQTRIPEVPDQQPFLDKWYDFHRGYRIVTKEDGSEERIAVLGEALREVSPGVLPRTLEELRVGREQSALEAQMRERERAAVEEQSSPVPNLEDTLDQLFESASNEDGPRSLPARQTTTAPSNVHAQAMSSAASRNREYQTRRIAALRRELHRMRNGIERVISGLRDLGENVGDASDATDRLTNLGRTLDNISGISSGNAADLAIRSVNELTSGVPSTQTDRSMANVQARINEARDHVDEARRMRDQAASELDVAEQEFRTSQQRLQTLQRDQRTQENYMRLFGTREEMMAAGENYESPIGGMFTRAMDRFRAAEDVRREERTLRQVLADEARAGGEEESRRLAEFEQRERSEDVWGVPRPPPQLAQDSTSNTTHLMENARDEVFAGQDLLTGGDLADMVAEAQQLDDDTLPGNDIDRTLEEYYALLRRQGWSQENRSGGQGPETNFPQNMLESIVSARGQELEDRNETLRGFANGYRTAINRQLPRMDPYFPTNEESRRDMVCLLHCLHQRDHVTREMLGLSTATVSAAIYHCGRVSEGPDWEVRVRQELENVELEILLQLDGLVWKSRLPAARLTRIRQAGHRVSFSSQPNTQDRELHRGNVELMAEAFQTSSRVRETSGLNAPEQLRMLYRLQASERQPEDRAVLTTMLDDGNTVELAKNVLRQHEGEHNAAESQRRQNLEELRREAAREGDSSRQELDQQRRATRDFALAAGRHAMQTGPQALMNRYAADTTSSQATNAHQASQRSLNGRERLNGPGTERNLPRDFARALELGGSSTEASEDEEEEDEDAKGLDAQDTGRPEAKSDEDMTVKLECRICYSQLADIACLPCGHLVMCKWCSEQHSPTMQHDRTRPRRAAGCPLCRKGIRQKVRVFRA